ncbi:hypothetical protein [Citricoccus muralis]|uniref:Uncharacterized protein n=1 Tax=Citricoccus muralis TaxID=169134 RepID=A0A3D9LDF6_9MICC|nr:hypothetical protein [Citricoccus muralis]REE03704.1 hypothetical protein C8E99_1520 [Citricoccus muralis]
MRTDWGVAAADEYPLAGKGVTGTLGDPQGWVRLAEHEHEDALLFSGATLVQHMVPRLTLDRYTADEVRSGRWPDPTAEDERWFQVAVEPYDDGSRVGWRVMRVAQEAGGSITETAWIFADADGLDIIRARYATAVHPELELLATMVVSEVRDGLRTGREWGVVDYGYNGPRSLPWTLAITRTGWAWLRRLTQEKRVHRIEELDRSLLEEAGLVEGLVPTELGHTLGQRFSRAQTSLDLSLGREGGQQSHLRIRVVGRFAYTEETSGDRVWLGVLSRHLVADVVVRFAGISPGLNRTFDSPLCRTADLQGRLADRRQPLPEGAGTAQSEVWRDTWYHWTLVGTSAQGTELAWQHIGTLNHGQYAVGRPGPYAEPGWVRMEPVPSSQLFRAVVDLVRPDRSRVTDRES